ncbi:MAG TPA: hypothetical protein VMH02_11535 [Verrucomicrobiae bacterium]|nr:hypothetical protein [Verrucomicrobiae bacterium]
MISGEREPRYRPLAWSSLASVLLHALLFVLLLAFFVRIFGEHKEAGEKVSETQHITIEHIARATPTPQPQRTPVPVKPAPAGASQPLHELAREVPNATPQPPVVHHPTEATKLAADARTYASEVAKLNAGNDPHAIPTIDPSQQGGDVKSYGFRASGDSSSEGNGIITTTQGWHENGLDCYYGRYSYTYPSGAMESGDIVWPFCYDPGSDPFRQHQHLIPFPFPQPGFRLPAGTDLPSIEKGIYEDWIGGQ